MKHIPRKYWFIALIIVQCVLLFIAFNKFFSYSDGYMLMNHGDGFKNYHTLHSYLTQSDEVDFWKFEQMNYPYGDYIFYTDNTPLLAVSIKLFSRYVYDVSEHGVFILHLFCILGILFSVILCWKILSRFIRHNWMLFVFSLSFVWANPQMLRLEVGHYNLSFSWLLLLTIWWLIRLTEVQPGERNKAIRLSIYLFLTIVAGAFIHLYYAMLLSVVIGAFFLGWGLHKGRLDAYFLEYFRKLRSKDKPRFPERKALKAASLQLGWGLGIAVSALVVVLTFIRRIDSYYALRKSVPEGYDFDVWRLQFMALLESRSWNTISSPFHTAEKLIHESGTYLGAFCVYGSLVVLLMFLLRSREWIPLKKITATHKPHTFALGLLLFVGLLSLSIAWGEKHYFFGTKHKFYNLLNPFLYLGMVTDTIKQFRCLGRFSWVFYWSLSFSLLYILQFYWEQQNRWRKALVLLLALFALLDTIDFVNYQNHRHDPNNLTNLSSQTSASELEQRIKADFDKYHYNTKNSKRLYSQVDALSLASRINTADYQALMPLPFYHNGSEDYNYTVDPPEDFYTFMVQFTQQTGLPCMGSKMSRTPPAHPKSFLSIFLNNQPAPELLKRLNDKPILVVVHKKYLNDLSWFGLPDFEPTNTAVQNMPKAIEKYRMKLLHEKGNYALYRWDLE